jgi:putative transposase
LPKHKGEPRKIVTDKLRSYGVAHRERVSETIHDTSQYAKNRCELSHERTRVRERGMRKFKSMSQAQGFLGTLAAVYNFSNLGRHLVSAESYRFPGCALLLLGKVQWRYRTLIHLFFSV